MEEKILSPMLIGRVVGQIGAALRNLRVYPSSHPISQKLFDSAYELLKEALTGVKEFSLSLAGNILLVNGKPVPDPKKEVFANFISEMGKRSIGNLVFYEELNKDELVAFFEIMAMDHDLVEKKGGMLVLLAQRSVYHITVEEIVYGRKREELPGVGAGEGVLLTWDELLNMRRVPEQFLARIEGNPQEFASLLGQMLGKEKTYLQGEKIMGAMEKVAETVASLRGRGSPQYVEGLSKLVDALQPPLQRRIIERGGLDPQWIGVIQKVIGNLSESQVISMIVEEYNEFREMLGPEVPADTREIVERMREFLTRILPDLPRREKFLPHIREELLKAGFTERGFQLLISEKRVGELLIKEMTAELAKKETTALLDTETILSVRRIIKEETEAIPILEIILTTFSHREPAVRKKAAERFSEIGEELVLNARYDLLDWVIDKFIERLYTEDNYEAYGALVATMEGIARLLLEKEKPTLATKISKILSEHMLLLSERPIAKEILQSLGRIGEKEAIRGLILALLKEPIFEESATVLSKLGDKPVPLLLETVRESEDRTMRLKCLYVLAKIGKDVAHFLYRDLRDERWHVRRNAVLLLSMVGDERAIDPLSVLINDKEPRVRKEAVKSIAKIGTNKAEPTLIEALDDKEEEVRLEAITSLGNLRSIQAVPALMSLFERKDILGRSQSPALKKAICVALAAIGDKRAISTLSKAMEDKDESVQESAKQAMQILSK
ncbi:MAG: HEAT repeat domain-containing protein [Candidatus Edwardsbacteria bacterium]